MFSKSSNSSTGASSAMKADRGAGQFSVLGTGVTVTGNIVAEGDLHVDGRIEGDVRCKALVLGESGHVAGAIVAEDARIAGTVEGSIDAASVAVEKTARTSGDIAYDTLNMDAGAVAEGRLSKRGTTGTSGLKLVAEQEA